MKVKVNRTLVTGPSPQVEVNTLSIEYGDIKLLILPGLFGEEEVLFLRTETGRDIVLQKPEPAINILTFPEG